MKKVDQVQEYKNISAEKLMEVFKDKSFYEARYAAAGVSDYEITEFGEQGNQFVIALKRSITPRPGSVPKMAEKFIGDSIDMTVTMRWELADSAPYKGTYEIDVARAPVDAKGAMTLVNKGDGCVNEMHLKVDCSIPFVGKKVEEAIAKRSSKSMTKDAEGTLNYLTENGLV